MKQQTLVPACALAGRVAGCCGGGYVPGLVFDPTSPNVPYA